MIKLHTVLPLDCRIFTPLLERLRKPVLANQLPDPLTAQFHQASETLTAQFVSFIRIATLPTFSQSAGTLYNTLSIKCDSKYYNGMASYNTGQETPPLHR